MFTVNNYIAIALATFDQLIQPLTSEVTTWLIV